jgi:hypothetical protein
MLIPNKALKPAITTGADNTTVNSGNKANTATKTRKTIGVAIPAAFAASKTKLMFNSFRYLGILSLEMFRI